MNRLVFLACIAVPMPVLGRSSTSPVAECAVSKQKAIGKKTTGLLKCYAKAIAGGVPVDPACINTVAVKFLTAIAKDDLKECAITGDARFQESAIDAFVAATEAQEYTTVFPCVLRNDECGSTCNVRGFCELGCPDTVGFRCVDIDTRVASTCKSDFDCQGVMPGSVCVDNGLGVCGTNACAMPCP